MAVAHGQMDEGTPRDRSCSTSGRGATTCWCARPSSSRASTCPRSTPWSSTGPTGSGLGQLHQLRGRVGRAGQRAYAYLFHPADRVLSEQAYERLRTIGEHTELGLGVQDRHARPARSGAPATCSAGTSRATSPPSGYDLYVQMVTEAVAELKGEPRPQPVELKLDLPDDAHLPADYVAAEDVRLEAYRRLAAVRDRRAGRRHPHRVGGPLRAAPRRRPRPCWTWPGCGSSACASGSPTWR